VVLHAFSPGAYQKLLDSTGEHRDTNDNKILNVQSVTSLLVRRMKVVQGR
jgi:hypothetical protein